MYSLQNGKTRKTAKVKTHKIAAKNAQLCSIYGM